MEFIHYGHDNFDLNKFEVIKNRHGFNKPYGGLWASPVDESKRVWKDWCLSESFHIDSLKNSFKFRLDKRSWILVIRSDKDLTKLDKYVIDLNMYLRIFDFEKMAMDYDAIYVEAGSNYDLYQYLYGWDVDSILVFNPDIIVP